MEAGACKNLNFIAIILIGQLHHFKDSKISKISYTEIMSLSKAEELMLSRV